MRGRKLISGIVIGSNTQFLTMVQGMPQSIEARLIRKMNAFMWGRAGSPPIALQTLTAPISKGGLNLLDLRVRNDAIHLRWLRSYLCLGDPNRPTWAFVADALISQHIPSNYRAPDPSTHINTFLQTWKPSLRPPHTKLPHDLMQMLKVAKKYNVHFDSLLLDPTLKRDLPIWFHFGLRQPPPPEDSDENDNHASAGPPTTKRPKKKQRHHSSQDVNSSTGHCLRHNHHAITVGDIENITLNRQSMPHIHSNTQCNCPACLADKTVGCLHPHSCYKAAVKLLDKLLPKWHPQHTPPAP